MSIFKRKAKEDVYLTQQATTFASVNIDGLIESAKAVSYQYLKCLYSQDIMGFPPQALTERMYRESAKFIDQDLQNKNVRVISSLNFIIFNLLDYRKNSVHAVSPIIYEARYSVTGRCGDGKTMNTFQETRNALFKFEYYDRGGYLLTGFRDEGVATVI